MDSPTKSAIKSLVLDLRHALEDEFTLALKRYGIFTDRAWSLDAPPDRLTDPAEREAWQRIVTVIRRGLSEGRTLPQASADYVREAAFTLLNRLTGLKCLEVRGIIPEIVTTREIYSGRSQAHRDYRDAHPQAARASDDALPAALAEACRRVNAELIGYLFDPDDDFSLLWPRYAVLKGCIEQINALDEAIWREDEIIGWLYQFYNAEEKVAVRRRGKPQTPHDVAVINQFFTPRWVVKFLVDNTLGRLWLEMHPDSARVREKCDYLVPEVASESANQRISESAIKREDENSQLSTLNFQLDSDSPINNPAAPPRRAAKPVTEIRLLDPACGTMHFGHYACEVFAAMYEDSLAHGWPIGESASERVSESASQREGFAATSNQLQVTSNQLPASEIPSLILRHNLFGVDIDRRAVQLAALSLFMKARTLHPEAQVRQVNLVSADATLPNSGVRERFLARYKEAPPVQRAFAQVLEDMNHVAQVGSLLRVEERLRELLAEAGYALSETGALRPRRQRTIPGLEAPVRQMEFGEQAEAGSGWTPGYTLAGLRDDLRAFANAALEEHDLNAQLFAAEADKAVRLLDVLMGEYDVVVMNPPFGSPLDNVRSYLKKNYKAFSNNLLCAFVERGIVDFTSIGYVGAVLDRTFLLKMSYEGFRRDILLGKGDIVSFTDLGWNVLDDANVEVSTLILGAQERRSDAIFMRNPIPDKLRNLRISDIVEFEWIFGVSPSEFVTYPNAAFAYWTPKTIRRMFQEFPSLDPEIGTAKEGIHPNDARRFLREHWEVASQSADTKWVPVANGGGYSPFYRDNQSVILYENEAEEIKNLRGMRNEHLQFREGITWGKRTDLISFQYLPPGCAFTHEGHCLFPHNRDIIYLVLSILNSSLMRYTANTICGQHKTSGYIGQLPFAQPNKTEQSFLESRSKEFKTLKHLWDTGEETSTQFFIPWLLQVGYHAMQREAVQETSVAQVLALLGEHAPRPLTPSPSHPVTLSVLLTAARAIETAADARLQALQAEIDEAVYELYEITPNDRALIERELGDRPPEVVWPQMEGKSDKEKRREHVRRLFSYYALRAARASDDGIVPLAGCAARAPTLIERVRALLEAEFGPEAAYQLEQDAAAYLERPLEAWLHTWFFRDFHVQRYKNRPILWHLASEKRAFAVLLDYHRLTRDTLPKVRSHYLWPQMEGVRTRLAAVKAHAGSLKEIADLEAELGDLEDCDRRLERVIQGAVEVEAPEWAVGPYRGGQAPYNPELDDGVAVNIAPVQAAGLLAGKVIK